MTDFIEIIIGVENEAQKDVFLAKLAAIGFEGFEEDRKLLKAYISEENFNQDEMEAVLEIRGADYSKSTIKQKNWNEEWETAFEPVKIGSFCAIRASFHAPVKGVEHEIVITPKMSFGTGHHATTFLMIQAMSGIDFKSKTVVDFGTGTGVLAILAEKLGASRIEAIDNDDWSIENGQENMRMNDCRAISLYKSDSLEQTCKADILLANINRNVIVDNFSSMKENLLPNGSLLLSGLLSGDLGEIQRLALGKRLAVEEVKERNGWICVHMINTQDN